MVGLSSSWSILVREAVVDVVDGSTADVGVRGADGRDVASKMMNSDVQIVPVDDEADCGGKIVFGDDDRTAPDGGGDGRPVACRFFVGFDARHDPADGVAEQVVEDDTGRRRHGSESEGDPINCACLGNLGDVEQVPGITNCCDGGVRDDDDDDDAEFDESLARVAAAAVEQDERLGYDACSDEDDDNGVDVAERYYDAECVHDDACDEHDDDGCCDSVSDSVSFEAIGDESADELPGSRSDSMLNRLQMRLDVVQELPDSGSEDMATGHSSGVDPLATSSPTSPVSLFDRVVPEHKSPLSSPPPDSSGKPPAGAFISRKSSSRSESSFSAVDCAPKSPEYAVAPGHKVELRPPKMTKRVSSFRKSLIKYVSNRNYMTSPRPFQG